MERMLKGGWRLILVAVAVLFLFVDKAHAGSGEEKRLWNLTLSSETKLDTPNPFVFLVPADLNQNGVKELVVNDFGWFHRERIFSDSFEEVRQEPDSKNLFILEWNGKGLAQLWSTHLEDYSIPIDDNSKRLVRVAGIVDLVLWKIGSERTLEANPPKFAMKPTDGSYLVKRHISSVEEDDDVSWALSEISPNCNVMVRDVWPKECLLGVRDFQKNGKPRIITAYEEKGENEKYTDWLRVRKMEPGFPIEWEEKISERFRGVSEPDPLNMEATGPLFFQIRKLGGDLWWLVEPEPAKPGYRIRPTKLRYDQYIRGKVGKTQRRGRDEIWVYLIEKGGDGYAIRILQRVTVKPDLVGLTKENIDFPHHEPYLGVEQFVLGDLDGDGLDELVLVEATGKREWADDAMFYSDIKDYVHILKWDGKGYRSVWVSPPYNKRGTRLLISDIKRSGKEQLIVGTGDSRIQIWEKK